jgi:deazaflavin-dependent oxidoreductase (nitroreductase family)
VADQTPPARDYSLFGDEHVRRYRETDGEVGHLWNGVTVLLLTTTRKDGVTPRDVPLIYGRDGDDLVVVASKGGAPDHPLWYRDLVRNPEVTVQVAGDVIPARARTASAEEKARLWPMMAAVWPDYDGYQARTDRDIPVVVLERR